MSSALPPDQEPLLGASSSKKGAARQSEDLVIGSSSAARNAWMDQPPDDDIPDDFKVGVTVADCDEAIRRAFLRKVYAILLCQVGLTALTAAVLMIPEAADFIHQHSWIIWTAMIGTFVSLGLTYWKRHSFPANMFCLALFTLCESIMIGSAVSYYDTFVVLQALLITSGVFVGLTLFTFQTKYDFSSFGPFLFAGLWGLITAGFVGFFLPFSHGFDIAIACAGVLIFSGYILYDTQQIMKRLSVDEAILGSLTLYLDFINLFLYVLRLLNSQNDNN
ncbi:vacuole protein [Trichosporon asahii var. asahii CBS 8904]|uniref:Vacuole protein n=2 Tax=Trichosporon asahii var. asahii TaxID=189963 RepID=K1VMY0_TRIAC|nr:vacuole protein [Trichosporon asahii var. asahii CBS 2479]EJT52685.1 vacuole protein [Trichosporon asahii var. asahii CBS 2479]EKD00752.1 vacuole protein [Trichosporon asahii var. asahii CBS 8904]